MTYQILSLDGGGSWALIEVRALIALFGEAATGHAVLGHFDLVAANSGGSLVLGGLLEDLPLGKVLALFKTEKNRRAVFSPSKSVADQSLRWLSGIGPKYSTAAKLPAIERLLPKTGDRKLSDVAREIIGVGGDPIHVLIVAFDYDRRRAAFFRSTEIDSGNGYGAAADVTVASAIHASTTPPINYFDAPAQLAGQANWYWDGGITGNNNPTLAACVEAATMGRLPKDLRVLSLGSASVCRPLGVRGAPDKPLYTSRQTSSLLTDLGELASSILDDPPDFATFSAHMLTGAGTGLPGGAVSRIVRMNPLIQPARDGKNGWTTPPRWTDAQFDHLCRIDTDALEETDIDYIDDWCSYWIDGDAPNQPIRMDWQTLTPEIGPGTFADAKEAWSLLTGAPLAPGAAGT